MDNLTHTLVGVTLVRAGLGGRTPGATATMILASNIPDADIVTAFGGSVAYLAAHRGPTHGPLGVVLLALTAALLVVAWRLARRTTRQRAWEHFTTLCGIALTGTTLHVLMDLPTSYGTRLLSPFDDTWFAFDWLPIIEIYIWGLLIAGLVAGRVRPERRRAIARATLILIVGVYVLRGSAHAQALALAASTRADGMTDPCASAPQLTRHPTVIVAAAAGPGACLQAAALPTFFSPLKWRLIRQQSDGYEMRDVVLGQSEPVSPRVFVPSENDRWVALARQTDTARVFLAFSRFPATRSARLPDGSYRVRAMDIRFLGPPPRALEADPQARAPFVITVELAPGGLVRSERLGN